VQKIGQKEKIERTKSKYFLLENTIATEELTRSKLSSRNQDRKSMQLKSEIIVLPLWRRGILRSIPFPFLLSVLSLFPYLCFIERSGVGLCFGHSYFCSELL
jgi:hypothetical protein